MRVTQTATAVMDPVLCYFPASSTCKHYYKFSFETRGDDYHSRLCTETRFRLILTAIGGNLNVESQYMCKNVIFELVNESLVIGRRFLTPWYP